MRHATRPKMSTPTLGMVVLRPTHRRGLLLFSSSLHPISISISLSLILSRSSPPVLLSLSFKPLWSTVHSLTAPFHSFGFFSQRSQFTVHPHLTTTFLHRAFLRFIASTFHNNTIQFPARSATPFTPTLIPTFDSIDLFVDPHTFVESSTPRPHTEITTHFSYDISQRLASRRVV
jgi:hypothetical protein